MLSEKIRLVFENGNISSKELSLIKFNTYKVKIPVGFFCTAKCYYCYYKNSVGIKEKLYDIYKIIDIAVSLDFKEFEFSGGEFFDIDYQDIKSVLDYVPRHIKISFVTNAYSINDNIIELLKNYNINTFLISLPGIKKDHDRILGFSDAFEKVYLNILKLQKDYKIYVNHVIEHKNYKNLDKFLNHLKHYKIEKINFLYLNNWDDYTYGKKLKNFIFNETYQILKINKDIDCAYSFKYVPYCWIDFNETNIMNYIHHFDNEFEWCTYLTEKEHFFDNHIINMHQTLINNGPTESFINFIKQHLINERIFLGDRDNECLNCSFKKVCDGKRK